MSEILIWVSSERIKPQLINVLSQIVFTYLITFLLMRWKWCNQVLAAARLDRWLFGQFVVLFPRS